MAGNPDWILYTESMDIPILGDSMDEQDWFDYLLKKYKSVKFDLVLAEGDGAGHFIINHGKELFGEACEVLFTTKTTGNPGAGMVNLISQERQAVMETFRLAVRQNPQRKSVVIIDNGGDEYRGYREDLEVLVREEGLAIREYTDFSYESLIESVKNFKGNEIVFYFTVSSDNRGRNLIPRQVLTDIAAVSPSPVYTFWSALVGSGCAGGVMVDGRQIALEMFEAAEQLMHSGDNEPVYMTNRTYIDWEAAGRYGLKWRRSSDDYILINKPEPFLANHYREVVIALFAVLLLFLILAHYSRSQIARAHRELTVTKNHLERAQQVANLGFWEYDIAAKKLFWSDAVYEIAEMDKETTVPTLETFLGMVHPEDKLKVIEKQKESLNIHGNVPVVHRILMKDGRIKWIEEHLNTEFGKDGKPVRSVGTTYDITHQKEGELMFKSLLANASDGIHILDEKGNLVLYSKSFARNLGYEYDEMDGMSISDWEGALTREQIESTVQLLLKSDITFETKHRRKDGTIFDVQVSATDIMLNGKKYIYASQRDISEQKSYIEQLNRLNAMLNAASKVGKIGFWEMDRDAEFVEWNEALYDIFETEKKTTPMNRKCFVSYIPEEEKKRLGREFHLSVEEKRDYSIIHDIITEKGHRRIVDERAKHFFDEEGQLIKSIGSVLDITERIEKETLIRKQKDEFETIFQTSLQGIALLDLDTKFLYANKKYGEILEYSVDELLTLSCYELTDPSERRRMEKVYEEVKEKGLYENFERFCSTRSGKTKRLISSIALMPDKKRFLITTADNTELYNAFEFIRKQAVTDELTQLGNRKAFRERLDELIAQYERYDLIFSLLIFDIDHFKSINDTYGHQAGDDVLAALSRVVSSMVRKNDYIFRVGGEEFVLLLSGTDLNKGAHFAEKVREAIQRDVTVIEGREVTVSIGVSEMERGDDRDSIFKKADDNLYRAKRTGRNRVCSG